MTDGREGSAGSAALRVTRACEVTGAPWEHGRGTQLGLQARKGTREGAAVRPRFRTAGPRWRTPAQRPRLNGRCLGAVPLPSADSSSRLKFPRLLTRVPLTLPGESHLHRRPRLLQKPNCVFNFISFQPILSVAPDFLFPKHRAYYSPARRAVSPRVLGCRTALQRAPGGLTCSRPAAGAPPGPSLPHGSPGSPGRRARAVTVACFLSLCL